MMNSVITEEQLKPIMGIYPVADFASGTVYSDIINVSNLEWLTFLVFWGVGTTGTVTITVVPVDDTSASNSGTAVAFYSRRYATDTDAAGALTARAAAGFTTTAGSDQLYAIEVDPATIATSGYKYCRLKLVEVANDPLLGGIIALARPKYPSASVATMLT
jgi:hypothetical protein